MLSARGIIKQFDGNQILRGVDLDVADGAITAIIGPSGGGKSTLLKALALLEPPDLGVVTIDDVTHRFPGDVAPPPWPKLNIVFQQLFLWPHLTLRENIELPLRARGAYNRGEVDALIARFALQAAAAKFPNQTSLGQRQRAALIRAIASKPRYLLLDEVTSALDVEHVGIMLDYLRTARGEGMSVVLVTHLIQFAANSADSVIFLDNGLVTEFGGRDMLSNPRTDRLKRFLSLAQLAS